jgi:hypothetical protein
MIQRLTKSDGRTIDVKTRAAELTAPYDQRFLEQPARFRSPSKDAIGYGRLAAPLCYGGSRLRDEGLNPPEEATFLLSTSSPACYIPPVTFPLFSCQS